MKNRDKKKKTGNKVSFGTKIVRFFKRRMYSIIKLISGFFQWVSSSIKNTVIFVTVISLVLVSTFLITHNYSSIEKMSSTYLDSVERSVIKENVYQEFDGAYAIKDFTLYGESFKVYKEKYAQASDNSMGKNMVLRNVATEKEYSYTYDDGADSGAKLGQLDEGLYEVYLFDQFTKKRVYTENNLQPDDLICMRRNGKVKNIRIDCNKDYLESFGITYDKNYMFLTVTETLPVTDVIDVMIDPGGYNVNVRTGADVEYFINDAIDESQAAYELALLVKQYLEEEYGLKADLTRGKEEKVGYYGKNGRAGRGFEQKAKVFLSLGMCENEIVTRPNIVTSAYSTGVNANYLCYASQNLGVELTALSKRPEFEPGVSYDMFTTDDNFEYTHWEFYPQLRETGGKATFTGSIDFAGKNSKYAESYGMCGFLYFFASAKNDESIDYFLKNKELIAQSIALGISMAYDLEGSNGQ
ncbi:MAG: hypothetical protein Q4C49_10430 [Bacillota bacterium]|nr:hypothetical protein [Bacillota bacterium]